MSLSFNFNLTSTIVSRQLSLNDRLIAEASERLSSGERLRRSADDPAGLVIANKLRHERIDADRGAANGEDGVSMLQTAEGGMDQMSTLLTRMRTLAVAAGNDATLDAGQRGALQSELDELVASFDRIATNTTFGGQTLLDGSFADNAVDTASLASYTTALSDARALPGGIAPGSALTFGPPSGPLTRDRVSATFTGAPPGSTPLEGAVQAGTALSGVGGSTVTITGPKGSTTLTLGTGTTIDDFVSLVNNATALTGARASYDATTGDLAIESENFGPSGLAVTSSDLSGGGGVGLLDNDVTTAANAFLTAAPTQTMDLTYVDGSGSTRTVTLAQDGTSDGGLAFRSVTGGPQTAGPFTGWSPGAFTIVMRDTSGGAIGSSVAVPAAAGTAHRSSSARLQLGGKAANSVAVEIPDLRAAAVGHDSSLIVQGYASLASLRGRALIGGSDDADAALKIIDAAINQVAGARGALGALQTHAVETAIDAQQTASVNLTSAESAIRDTDFAAESANYTRLQILMQAATAMLAQANQVPQTVLQLLQRN